MNTYVPVTLFFCEGFESEASAEPACAPGSALVRYLGSQPSGRYLWQQQQPLWSMNGRDAGTKKALKTGETTLTADESLHHFPSSLLKLMDG
ncbi:unnamed protein product [Boreogadus saida]